MEQLVFILIAGGIALLNWLLKSGGSKLKEMSEQAQQEQTTARPQQSSPGGESEDERMRKFFEALGLPASTAQPPKLQRPVQPPPLSRTEVNPELARRARQFREAGGKSRPSRQKQRAPEPPAFPAQSQRATPSILQPGAEGSELPGTDYVSGAAAAIASTARDPERPAKACAISSCSRDELFAALRSPAEIRKAILLVEILGLPRGLQSRIEPHTFPIS